MLLDKLDRGGMERLEYRMVKKGKGHCEVGSLTESKETIK